MINRYEDLMNEATPTGSARVMILEDEMVVGMDLSYRLTQLGYEVVGVYSDATSALKGIEKRTADLAILDIWLGHGMNGIDVGAKLREEYEIPFIYLTAYSDRDTLRRAKRTEPLGYLVKPISDADLKSTLEIALHKHQSEQARRKAELEAQQLREQLFQAQKMDAVGKLAAGIAHDLNNSLTAVIGNLEYLRMPATSESKSRECLDLTIEGCRRSAKLIQQLLAFSQQGRYELQTVSLPSVIESVARFLSRVITRDNVTLDLPDTSGEFMPVEIDRGQIDQVFINLVMNAKESMTSGGSIFVTFNQKEVSDPAPFNPSAVPGNYYVLNVRDTGTGIPSDILPRIFEPFFTTKSLGQGTGLGLAMVYGTMQSHGGWVEVESTPGKGTIFRLYFPEARSVNTVPN